MMSQLPIDSDVFRKEMTDIEALRVGLIAELDAINLYEQLSASARDEKIKKLFLEIAREEKTHVGEFEAMLLALDMEQGIEMQKGKKEAEELA